ncbi:MAG: HAD-IB family phosphatase [Candidatus Eisenbacteria sp.]|nr:HAD-IB family phosphatase [Candidatus Eisenbacteria bacterium]
MSSRVDHVVICDFDGTVARADVGNSFFGTFAEAPWADAVQEWKEGRIGSKECLEKECRLTTATLEDLRRFSSLQDIDPGFHDVVGWTREHYVPLAIVSDGFREYISLILGNHGLDVPCFANRVEFKGSRLRPSFPYFERGCGRCANCKGFHVRRYRDAGYRTVFIGDGLSDLCALPESDVVLAKNELADHCEREKIPHTRIADLGDALHVLRELG